MGYYCRKIGGLLLTLVLVSLITFGVFQILPGNPAYIILGVDADPLQIEALTKSMGLDLPLYQRYIMDLGSIKRRSGNFISLSAASDTVDLSGACGNRRSCCYDDAADHPDRYSGGDLAGRAQQ